jgi:hypothetical protein
MEIYAGMVQWLIVETLMYLSHNACKDVGLTPALCHPFFAALLPFYLLILTLA